MRRGEVFGLAIVCKNRAYDLNRDRLAIIVEFGKFSSGISYSGKQRLLQNAQKDESFKRKLIYLLRLVG